MPDKFQPFDLDLDQVASQIHAMEISKEDRELIRNLGLPGTEGLFAADPETGKSAARVFLSNFLMAGEMGQKDNLEP